MSLNLFLTFDVESNRPGNYITCEHVPGAPGLFWIMDELERHGARGVFFVNVYEHTRYPDGWMQDILRQIDERGHEVALHCHANPALDFYSQNLTSYDVAGQSKVLRYGVDFIRSAIGHPPVSFRSGALRINQDTVIAMQECGLRIDSSLMYAWNKHNYNDIGPYRSVNRSINYGAVQEFPITVIDREYASIGRDGRRRGLRSCHRARLDPNSIPDAQALILAIKQMISSGCRDAVFMAHSFSFILLTDDESLALPGTSVFMKNRKPPNYVRDQDVYLKSVFVDLLCFLEEKRASVRTTLFKEAKVETDRASVDVDFVPRVPFNGLWSWPTLEDYAKLRNRIRKLGSAIYRASPKHVVLHVGTWKTGSKALQKFWAVNRDELRKQGIFYPLDVESPYMKGGNPTYQSLLASSGTANRRERLQCLADEIADSDCKTCLMSHENICNLPESELIEFVSSLSGCTFKIVIYLRRQDYYAESLYNQHVKAGVAFAGSFDEHFECYRGRYDYQEIVERLGRVFGLTSIMVRPYEKEQFFGGSIFADFMHHVFQLENLDRLRIPERDHNSRLDHDALEFKRLINGFDGPKERKHEIGRHLVKYCVQVDPRSGEAFQAHELLSPQRRLALLQEFAEGNAWVARTCLGRPDGGLFLEPSPSLKDAWTEYGGLTATKAAELAFHIYRSMESETRQTEAKRAKAGRGRDEPQPGSRARQRGRSSIGRAVKRFWKRQFRQGKALVSRLRLGSKARPGEPRYAARWSDE